MKCCSPQDILAPMNRIKILTALLGILTLIAVGAVLKAAQSVILPLMVAWLLSYLVAPIINYLKTHKVPLSISIACVLVVFAGVCYLVGTFLFSSGLDFAASYGTYERKLLAMLDGLEQRLRLPADVDLGYNLLWKIGTYVDDVAKSFLLFLSNLIMVIIFLVFLLLGKPYFNAKLKLALSPKNAQRVTGILTSVSRQFGRYLSCMFVISLTTGVLVTMALRIIGVDFAVTWGGLAFVLNFIPTVGSIIASIPPILVALVQFSPDIWPAIITAASLLTIQMVIGNGIAPKLLGDTLNLSPVVVLLSLLFWYWLWGPIGAILSVPIAAVIKIVCDTVEPLNPIGILMGSGRTYQRKEQAKT